VIELCVADGKIELAGFSPEESVAALARAVEEFRLHQDLKTRYCCGCGGCCDQAIPVLGLDLPALSAATGLAPERVAGELFDLPAVPTAQERRRAIRDMVRQNGFTEEQAALLYDHNRAEPIILKSKRDGTCIFLRGRLCSIYESRPFMCRLYLCNMGEELSVLYEKIIGQGIWHAYARMGWIDESELGSNPFVGRSSYEEVLLGEFEADLSGAAEKLFFFF